MLSAPNGQGVLWIVFAVVVSLLVALDLGVLQKNPRDPSPKEALLFTLVWVALATLFGAGVTAVPIGKSGKNALDFHLSFYMGYIASRNPASAMVVVANDKGYEPMLEIGRAHV